MRRIKGPERLLEKFARMPPKELGNHLNYLLALPPSHPKTVRNNDGAVSAITHPWSHAAKKASTCQPSTRESMAASETSKTTRIFVSGGRSREPRESAATASRVCPMQLRHSQRLLVLGVGVKGSMGSWDFVEKGFHHPPVLFALNDLCANCLKRRLAA